MNYSTDDLMNVISKALASPDADERQNKQKELSKLCNSNPNKFFLTLGSIISSVYLRRRIRQSVGGVAITFLSFKKKNGNKLYWDDLDDATKQQFKQQILGVLISPIPQVIKVGARIIAVIAAIELPRGNWERLVQILHQTCIHQDLRIKTGSITTIAYIAQQIKNSSQSINNYFSELILSSIIVGTRQQEQSIIQISLEALKNCLSFMQQLMADSKYRDIVFDVFTNNFKNDVFVQNTYQALYQFVKVTGEHLMNYQKPLSDFTIAHLAKHNNYYKLNLKLWQVIGTNYAQKEDHTENFTQTVMLLIFNQQEKEDQNELKTSAARAFQAFTKACDKN